MSASWSNCLAHAVLFLVPLGLTVSFSQATGEAATIYASGQRLVPAVPGVHDDLRENYIFAIDSSTGIAHPFSPLVSNTPAALAGSPTGQLFGFRSGQLGEVNPATGGFTPIGVATGVSATAFDITADGRGFILPFNANSETQQLNQIDLSSGALTSIGSSSAIGDAIDARRGTSPGTAEPFIISLGSVANLLYGVDLDTYSLVSLTPDTGIASVVGQIGAVQSGSLAAYSGFAALTGVDTDQNGSFDALFGNVNFFDPDGSGPAPTERLGGVARFDLSAGTWSLVGTNPGVIFFGFGSSPYDEAAAAVPEPATMAGLFVFGALGAGYRWRQRR
jgi:hypothetical protein